MKWMAQGRKKEEEKLLQRREQNSLRLLRLSLCSTSGAPKRLPYDMMSHDCRHWTLDPRSLALAVIEREWEKLWDQRNPSIWGRLPLPPLNPPTPPFSFFLCNKIGIALGQPFSLSYNDEPLYCLLLLSWLLPPPSSFHLLFSKWRKKKKKKEAFISRIFITFMCDHYCYNVCLVCVCVCVWVRENKNGANVSNIEKYIGPTPTCATRWFDLSRVPLLLDCSGSRMERGQRVEPFHEMWIESKIRCSRVCVCVCGWMWGVRWILQLIN